MSDKAEQFVRDFQSQMNIDAIVPTCILIAREIEHMPELRTGKEKLKMLQRILRILVLNSNKSAEDKKALFDKIDTVIPLIVESAITVSKNPIVRKVQDTCVGCWKKK